MEILKPAIQISHDSAAQQIYDQQVMAILLSMSGIPAFPSSPMHSGLQTGPLESQGSLSSMPCMEGGIVSVLLLPFPAAPI